MHQTPWNKDNTTIELITHLANEYIIPIFTATLLFGPIINAFMWLTDNEPAIRELLYPLAASNYTITQATGKILAVLLIMASPSLAQSMIMMRKRPSHTPSKEACRQKRYPEVEKV